MSDTPTDAPVLSNEEVDALLKGNQDKTVDLSSLSGATTPPPAHPDNIVQDSTALANVMDAVRIEWEKVMSAFLRKKIRITIKNSTVAEVNVALENTPEKLVYTLFRIPATDHYGVIITSMPFLSNTINLLYGGKINPTDPPLEAPGKVGVIVSERLSHILMSGFAQACSEFGSVNYEIVKSTPFVNLLTNLNLDDQVYTVESTIIIDEVEGMFKFVIMTDFLTTFFPQRRQARHKEKDFWRSAINTQVSDSMVNVSVIMPDVTMKMQEVMALKEGDTIPIADPNMVYICLNNLKLFRASAGQANNKRVAKVISQI